MPKGNGADGFGRARPKREKSKRAKPKRHGRRR